MNEVYVVTSPTNVIGVYTTFNAASRAARKHLAEDCDFIRQDGDIVIMCENRVSLRRNITISGISNQVNAYTLTIKPYKVEQ